MSIHFVYGVPRSGKSYYAVFHLLKNYFDWIEGTGGYHLKEKYKDIRIVTNLECLKVPHDNLDDWIHKAGGVDIFFSYDFQEDLFKKCPQIVYIIDECHKYFPDNYRNNDVFNWFSYHGHWGQTIYLISQSQYNVPRRITHLVEIMLYALPRSSSLFGGKDLKYNVISGREIVDKKTLIKQKKIFAHYKSQDKKEVEKVKNPMMKYIVVMLVALVLVGFKFASFIGDKKDVHKGEGSSSGSAIASTDIPQDKISTRANGKSGRQPAHDPGPDTRKRVKLSSVKDHRGLQLIIGDMMIPKRDFPHPVFNLGNQYVAMLTPDEIELYGLTRSDPDAQERAGGKAQNEGKEFALRR